MTATKLFSPLQLGRLELKNRIIFPAVTTAYDTNWDLKGNEHSADFYASRARGGASLLVVGALQAIYPGRREAPRVQINEDRYIPHLKRWTDAIHAGGAAAAAHLGVWNYWSRDGVHGKPEYVSPSGIVTLEADSPALAKGNMFDPTSRALTIEEIGMIGDEVARSAVRAVEAGFDAIELAVVAQNLLERFLIPHTNRRTDSYGGSLNNRFRFTGEVISKIQDRVGKDYPLICRVAASDLLPWGLELSDWIPIARLMETAGAHALSVMPGGYDSKIPRHQMSVPRNHFVYLSQGLKQAVKIPVITNMRISDPNDAERILAEGKADAVALCRPLIADPSFPKKALEGRYAEIRSCVACCVCFEDIATAHPMGCSVNARAGREIEFPAVKAPTRKKVLVAGGGPGGMEAARVAAMRGHRVVLCESGASLGGQLLYAVIPPFKQEWRTFIDFLSHQLSALGVEVRVNCPVTSDLASREKADAVLVASGSTPLRPPIKGNDLPNVCGALDILGGRITAGKKVAVIGGGLVGCETAEFLAQAGHRVTILEMLPEIGQELGNHNRWVVMARLNKMGVKLLPETRAGEIVTPSVRATQKGRAIDIPADTVVLATGFAPDETLFHSLKGKVPQLQCLGACAGARRVKETVAAAFEIAYRL